MDTRMWSVINHPEKFAWFCECPLELSLLPQHDGLGECTRCHRITRERAAVAR